MNGPGLDAPSPARRSRTLVLIAMILIGVPLGTIGWLNSLPEDTGELVSCQGNVTLKDGRPFVHAHVTISDHSMRTRGGHLFEATVSAVGEFFLRRVDSSVHRKLDEDIGLPTWCTTDHKE